MQVVLGSQGTFRYLASLYYDIYYMKPYVQESEEKSVKHGKKCALITTDVVSKDVLENLRQGRKLSIIGTALQYLYTPC